MNNSCKNRVILLVLLINTCITWQIVTADEFVRNAAIKYGIIRAGTDFGQTKRGSASASELLWKSGLIEALKEDGADIKDFGDLNTTIPAGNKTKSNQGKEIKFYHEVAKVNEQIYQKVKDVCADNRIAITLGGDHSISIGTLAATSEVFSEEDLGILWVDAHGDINTMESTPSGHLFGMPLSFIIKELQDPNKTAEFEYIKSNVPVARLVYIGPRDLDPWEKTLIRNMNIHAFTMTDIVQLGIQNVIRMAKEILSPNNKKPFHVSFDIDVISPTEAPSTGTPVPGGLLLREAISLVEQLASTGKMVAFDMAEVNPKLGTVEEAERTVLSAKHILMAALGQRRGVY